MDRVARLVGLWLLVMGASYVIGASLGLVYGLTSAATKKLLRFWNDFERAPKRRGAHQIDDGTAFVLLQDLAERANIPPPRLHVIDSPHANAMASSRDYRHASICVTTGLLNCLGPDELSGVLAHELAHVIRRSTFAGTAAAVLSAAVSLLPFAGPFVGLGIGRSLVLLVVGPSAAFLAQLAFARAGEYAADACGARLAGSPDALASALRIVTNDDVEFGDEANNPTAKALLTFGRRLVGPGRDNPFSAYPQPKNRIAALERMSFPELRGRRASNSA